MPRQPIICNKNGCTSSKFVMRFDVYYEEYHVRCDSCGYEKFTFKKQDRGKG